LYTPFCIQASNGPFDVVIAWTKSDAPYKGFLISVSNDFIAPKPCAFPTLTGFIIPALLAASSVLNKMPAFCKAPANLSNNNLFVDCVTIDDTVVITCDFKLFCWPSKFLITVGNSSPVAINFFILISLPISFRFLIGSYISTLPSLNISLTISSAWSSLALPTDTPEPPYTFLACTLNTAPPLPLIKLRANCFAFLNKGEVSGTAYPGFSNTAKDFLM